MLIKYDDRLLHVSSGAAPLTLLMLAFALIGCSGSSEHSSSATTSDDSTENIVIADGFGEPDSDPTPSMESDPLVGGDPLPTALALLQQETELLAPVPLVQFTQTMANTGIQISYTDNSLVPLAPGELIEAQWVFMQACVQQVGAAPLVLVTHDPIMPFTVNDDVVRNQIATASEITTTPIASASSLHGDVVQISIDDFDGSLGAPLFNLKSIMGRYLWLTAGLPARDYPHDCAKQTV